MSTRRVARAPDVVIHLEVVGRIGEIKGLSVATKGEDRRPQSALAPLNRQRIEVVFDLPRRGGIPGRITHLLPVGSVPADPDIHRIGRLERVSWVSAQPETAEQDEVVEEHNHLVSRTGRPLGFFIDQGPFEEPKSSAPPTLLCKQAWRCWNRPLCSVPPRPRALTVAAAVERRINPENQAMIVRDGMMPPPVLNDGISGACCSERSAIGVLSGKISLALRRR